MENYTVAKYLLTVMPDVCVANGKDPAATELLNKMRTYGEVIPFEKAEEKIRAEYQGVIDNLTRQYQAIAAQELTQDEIIFLNTYRECKSANGEAYEKRIAALEQCLEDVRIASKKRAEQIAQLVAELAEANG